MTTTLWFIKKVNEGTGNISFLERIGLQSTKRTKPRDYRDAAERGTKRVFCTNCRTEGHRKVEGPRKPLCRYCRVELGDTHKEYQCPKKNACFYCHKAGHQKNTCLRKEEDMENGVRRDIIPFGKNREGASGEVQPVEMSRNDRLKAEVPKRRKAQ